MVLIVKSKCLISFKNNSLQLILKQYNGLCVWFFLSYSSSCFRSDILQALK